MAHPTAEITNHVQEALSNFEMLKGFRQKAQPHILKAMEDGIGSFKEQGYPTTRHEEWKYTSVRSLLDREYNSAFMPPRGYIVTSDLQDWWRSYTDPTVLVFVNGHLSKELSSVPSNGPTVKELDSDDSATVKEKYAQIVQMEGNPFVALNTALAQNGLSLTFPKNYHNDSPTFVVHLNDSAQGNVRTYSRTFIHVEQGAEANLVEFWANEGGAHSFANHVCEILVRKNARLNHHVVQGDTDSSSLINFTQAEQERDSIYRNFTVSTSGEIVRNDTNARHLDSNIETHLFGLYLLDRDQHVDNHTLVDHALPNCYSNELYKGVLDGASTAVFNGKVMVRPDAQKTNAFQSNKTILLSEDATINTKPQLEIYADDVKCSHGATTGRLDKESLFYLRSRGVGEKQARALLTYAFAAEVLEEINLEPLRERLENTIKNRLF